MLKSLVHIGFAWRSSDARRHRRHVEERLRAEAMRARIEPSPELRRRTLAALTDVSMFPAPAVSMMSPRGRVVAGGYTLAFVALVAVGAVAVHLGLPRADDGAGTAPPARIPAIFATTRFDSILQRQLRELPDTWESPLRTEARLIARDARAVGENALASVALLAGWDHRRRSEG